MTSFLAATKVDVVLRQDRTEHVERTNVGRGLAASVRVRGEDEVRERLPEFHLAPRFLPDDRAETDFVVSGPFSSNASSIAARSRQSSS